jgi:hypothetical protein
MISLEFSGKAVSKEAISQKSFEFRVACFEEESQLSVVGQLVASFILHKTHAD